jgi:hypothetical protein
MMYLLIVSLQNPGHGVLRATFYARTTNDFDMSRLALEIAEEDRFDYRICSSKPKLPAGYENLAVTVEPRVVQLHDVQIPVNVANQLCPRDQGPKKKEGIVPNAVTHHTTP